MCGYGNDTILAVRSVARHDRSGGFQGSQGIAMTRSLKLPACTAEAEYIEIDNGWFSLLILIQFGRPARQDMCMLCHKNGERFEVLGHQSTNAGTAVERLKEGVGFDFLPGSAGGTPRIWFLNPPFRQIAHNSVFWTLC